MSTLASPPGGPAPALASAPVRVLLVEDDDGDAFLVADSLAEHRDLELVRVRSVAEVRLLAQRLTAAPIACALVDLGLPDSVGMSALVDVLSIVPSAAVVVLTGIADEYRGVQAVAAGAQDYLIKGQVDGAVLARAIRYAVERRRAEDSLRRLREAELRAEENSRLERGLLPTPLLGTSGLRSAVRYRPGRQRAVLGGDFYDLVETPDGVVHVIVGDVSGHGPDEAALGASLRIAWRSLILAGLAANTVLPVLEQVLIHERATPATFTTACTVTLPPGLRTAMVALAGHPPPLLLTNGDVVPIGEPPGPPLGVLPGHRWPESEADLVPGWMLALYTDGLIEARPADGGESLDIPGLVDYIRALPLVDAPDRLADELVAAVGRIGAVLLDDLEVVVLADAALDAPRSAPR